MNEANHDYVSILEDYLKYYAKISIRDLRYSPNVGEIATYDNTYGSVHIAETVHKDDVKIRTLDVTNRGGKSFSFIIGPALMLFSSRYSKYREDLVGMGNIKGVISLKRGIISEKMYPSAIIVVDKNSRSRKVWFSSASTITDILDLIFEEKSEHHMIYYAETINKNNFSPEYYNKEKFSVGCNGDDTISIKELQDLAEIIPGKVIPSKELKKSGFGYVRGRNIVNGIIQEPKDFVDISMVNKYPKGILQEGDILLTAEFGQRKIAQVKSENLPAFAFGGLIIIRPHGVSGKYLYRYLTSQTGKKAFDEQLMHIESGFFNHISPRDLKHIQVPIYDDITMQQIENIDSIPPEDVPNVLMNLLRVSKCEINSEQYILDELVKKGWKSESFNSEISIQINNNESYKADLCYKLDDGRLVLLETKISIKQISPEWVNKIQRLLSKKENFYFILTNGYYYEIYKSGVSQALKLLHAPTINELLMWEKEVK